MQRPSLSNWLKWVTQGVHELHSEPPGEIILDQGRGTIPLEKKNFLPLYPGKQSRKIAVIDGGSAAIFASQAFTVGLVKVYGAFFENGQCTEQHSESTTAILRMTKGKKIEVKIEHLTAPVLFESNLLPQSKGPLQAALNQVRNAMELTTARTLAEKLHPGDLLLLDGSLTAGSEYDTLLYESLLDVARNRNVLVLALSKTTQLACTSGLGAVTALRLIEPQKAAWIYQGYIGERSTHFAKLHPKAPHILRIDGPNEPIDVYVQALEHLLTLSKDPAFLGYPFPLIRAHTRAKIIPEDANVRSAILRANLGRAGDITLEQETGHETLDKS